MSQYVRIVSAISWAAGMLAVAFLASSVLVICQMVFVRYLLGQSTIWQTEYAIYSIVAATFIGSAYVLMLKGHVNVDLLPMALPPGPRLVLNAISGVLSLAFCALLAYSGWTYFYEAWAEGWRTASVWRLPLWIPLLPLPLGIALLCLQYIAELWKLKEAGR
jgi:TRAP-type C4-dicarboxylate transport system permease small subunit